jgi:anaerobic magnesium-protoporphyrin IX monomethyl ester cyclase
MKVILLFPPQWTAGQPYYALSTLNGQLKRAGYDVSIRDLNLEYMERVLDAKRLRFHDNLLKSELNILSGEALLRLATDDRSERLALIGNRIEEVKAVLAENCDSGLELLAKKALNVFRDSELFFDPEKLVSALGTLDDVLRFVSALYYPSSIRWNDFSNPACRMDYESVLEYCRNPDDNPFRSFYENLVPEILAEDPRLITITISAMSQLLPGLTLAEMVKERLGDGYRAHLSLGGNHLSRLREELMRLPEFFQVFADSVIIGEGEGPIVSLANEIASRADAPTETPDLLYLNTEGIVVDSRSAPPPPLGDLAFQDLTGFPMDRYLAPERIVCIRSSKGCSWNQCVFCDAHFGEHPDMIEVDRLAAEIIYLRDNFGIYHYEFIDECISPQYLDSMCDYFIEENLGVRWFCNARTEEGFTRGLFRKMKRAGATMILWGIESASARLLTLMNKGVETDRRLQMLRDASEAGLWNFAYIFFGFPSETREEAESTIDLICENTEIIHSYGRSVFSLGKHSLLFRDPEKYGILDCHEDRQGLASTLNYRSISGIQGKEISEVARLCTERCSRAYGSPLWMTLGSRENLHLYLARYGKKRIQTSRYVSAEAESKNYLFY